MAEISVNMTIELPAGFHIFIQNITPKFQTWHEIRRWLHKGKSLYSSFIVWWTLRRSVNISVNIWLRKIEDS